MEKDGIKWIRKRMGGRAVDTGRNDFNKIPLGGLGDLGRKRAIGGCREELSVKKFWRAESRTAAVSVTPPEMNSCWILLILSQHKQIA